MPRPDLFGALHPGFDGSGSDEGADPELRSFRSGFWVTLALTAPRQGSVELRLEAVLAGGGTATATLGSIPVAEPGPPAAPPRTPTVAIAMATYDPDPALLRTQLDSLRAQTHTDWICAISDDCSPLESFAEIERQIAGDDRFLASRSPERLGFYRNFERALELVPASAELVALCDQDDDWYPHKLERLAEAIGDAELVYSDQRLVDAGGARIAETFWDGRRNNYTDLTSLLVANTVTGAASMFRRETLAAALPFPQFPGWQFHDHWLALVALARGPIAYVDEPLYDYVQHRGAILGQVSAEAEDEPSRPRLGARLKSAVREQLTGWRPIYFCGYMRLAVQAEVLLARCSAELAPAKRRALERFVDADRRRRGIAWLSLRGLRRFAGRSETLGAEGQLARGLAWRRITAARTRRVSGPVDWSLRAEFPPCGPDSFGQRRLRRWRRGRARA